MMTESDEKQRERLPALLLTAEEVAEMLKVTVWTVRGLHRLGRLRGVVIARKLRFRPAEVQRYLEELQNE